MTKAMDSSKRLTTSRTIDGKALLELHCPVCGRWCLNYLGQVAYLELRCKNKHWFRFHDGIVEALLPSDVYSA